MRVLSLAKPSRTRKAHPPTWWFHFHVSFPAIHDAKSDFAEAFKGGYVSQLYEKTKLFCLNEPNSIDVMR